jgi:Domain of unknown function (DUF4436)
MKDFLCLKTRWLLIGLCSLFLVFGLHEIIPGVASASLAQESPLSYPVTVAASPSPAASKSPPTAPSDEEESKPTISKDDLVEVSMTVVGVDPVKGEIEARLEFTPKGIYNDEGSDYLAQPMLLTVNSIEKQGSEIPFKANKQMDAVTVKFATTEGDANGYPFDNHAAETYIYLDAVPVGEEAEDATDYTPVKMNFSFSSNLPGYDISESPIEDEKPSEVKSENPGTEVAISVGISRSLSVRLFAVIVMVIMWILSILALSISIRVLLSGKLPEIGMLGWMAALLFAFPAVRNAQPAVPPVGTLCDFLSFFWAEVFVVTGICALGFSWLRRYNAPAIPAK